VDRAKQGLKRSVAVDAHGIPLGVVAAPANCHDWPLLGRTLETVEASTELPEDATVHLDRAYDSKVSRELLEDRGLLGMSSKKGKPAPIGATKRWVVERTNSWSNAHRNLVWCTEREGRVVDFWIAFSNAIIIVGRLVRETWTRYRWPTRPTRRP
jgi:IS5 family transposase